MLHELEAVLGQALPAEFKRMYQQRKETVNLPMLPDFHWLQPADIQEEWRNLQAAAYQVIAAQPGVLQDGGFRKGWIPFATDGKGSFLLLDLEPGKLGEYGQIISLEHDSEFTYVIAKDITAFLQWAEGLPAAAAEAESSRLG